MAKYTVKLIDHTGTIEMYRQNIRTKIQELFDEAFKGTPDAVTVSWGTASPSDNLILHFVEDAAHSYVQSKLPGREIKPNRGGHTHCRGALSGSEFYMFSVKGSERHRNRNSQCARLAL